MVEVLLKKRALEEPIDKVEIFIVEELPVIEEDVRIVKVRLKDKPIKKALLKLFKKARYNAKYFEETTNIDKARKNMFDRNYGSYMLF